MFKTHTPRCGDDGQRVDQNPVLSFENAKRSPSRAAFPLRALSSQSSESEEIPRDLVTAAARVGSWPRAGVVSSEIPVAGAGRARM